MHLVCCRSCLPRWRVNYLPAEMAAKVSEENETYQVENPWKAPIVSWLNAAKQPRHRAHL
jgi:hypothetical protein